MTTFMTILPNEKIATRKSAHPYTHMIAVKWPGEDWGMYSCHSTYEAAKAKEKYLLHCPGNLQQMSKSFKSVEVRILPLCKLENSGE